MTLTVSEDGQVTLPQEVLDRYGIKPGEQISFNLVRNEHGEFHADSPAQVSATDIAATPRHGMESIIGMFKTDKQVSIEEMNEVIAKGWAGLLDDEDDD